jgi:hypothetical protein
VIENIAVFLDVKSYSQGDRSTVVRNVDTVLRCYTASRYRTQESSLSAQLILFAFSDRLVWWLMGKEELKVFRLIPSSKLKSRYKIVFACWISKDAWAPARAHRNT